MPCIFHEGEEDRKRTGKTAWKKDSIFFAEKMP